ncbi:unnamed protein product [Symbiodinium natans]|uniref:Uncharacterized protein n=1 Tax=Symbiodinium natans TaxID=878477 RepID=A0A812USR7_9DINO|nr:unnamed protein product [Symbiodinium natans]
MGNLGSLVSPPPPTQHSQPPHHHEPWRPSVDKMSALHLLRSRETPMGLMPELVNATIGHQISSARELTLLLASFARRALWRSAVVLLSQARAVVDMPALGAALAACERGSQWSVAAALLEDFQSQLLSPDDGAAASVLAAAWMAS